MDVPIFYKEDNKNYTQNYFPFIKESISENNPFIFGRYVDKSPYFATNEQLHSNISVLGVPGSGKGAFIHSLMFQLMMNNRGFCLMNPLGQVYSSNHIKKMATLLNKKMMCLFSTMTTIQNSLQAVLTMIRLFSHHLIQETMLDAK